MSPRAFENNSLCKIWGQTKCITGNSKIENDPRSYERNFCNCVKKPEKFASGSLEIKIITFPKNSSHFSKVYSFTN